jgi:putative ABC transport system permease protein
MRPLRRLAQWLRLGSRDADLAEELAFHREAIERDLIARGHSPAEARDAARRSMGNETRAREEVRGVWLWPMLDAVWQDARITVRGLGRNPVFAIGVMLTFALGVGANAAMFSLIDRMMLRPPALMRDPARVHRVYMYRTSNGVESETGGQYARNADIARWSTNSFSAVAMHTTKQLAVGVGQDAREMRIGIVSANFFGFFDAPPAAGRYFGISEDAPPSGSPVAVLSYATWQAQYGGRQDAIGSTLRIDAVVYTIIGVAAKDFVGLWPLRPPMAYIPMSTYAASALGPKWRTTYSSSFGIGSIARRKPGVSIDAASADLTKALVQSYRAEGGGEGRLAALRPRALAGSVLIERGPSQSDVARVATWLGGVAIIVLLIACANVASLLLARALSRRREIAVRLALGVSRTRLFIQLLTESMVLAVAGSILGVVVGTWMSAMLKAAFLPNADRLSVAEDPRTLAFIGIITLVSGVFTGVLPALQTRRLTLTDDLKAGARAGTFRRSRTRSALLILQGALSLVLLVGAGLFVRSLRNVRDVRLGFDPDSVLVVTMKWRDVKLDSAQTSALRLRLVSAATTVPGIAHATLQLAAPFGGMADWPIAVAGIDSVKKFGRFEFNAVSPGYFATMGTRIRRGRGFESSDLGGGRGVLVVGEAMGKVLWPNQDALGKCVRIGIPPDTMPCRYVVGVAEDIHARGFGAQAGNFYYYVPAAQWHQQDGGLFVRIAGDARRLMEPLRRRLQEEMPGSSYVTVSRLGDLVDAQSRSWVMGATVFTAFGGLALLLAAVGLYSVIAYNVAQRRQELAVRVALGAAISDVMRLVVGEGMRFAVTGAVIGSAIALSSAPRIAPLLFNQSPRDPVVFGAVTACLLLVAVIASVVPAIRGARVDPNGVLRAE